MSLHPVKQKRNNAVISKMELSEQIRDYLRCTTITLHQRDVDYKVNIFQQTRVTLRITAIDTLSVSFSEMVTLLALHVSYLSLIVKISDRSNIFYLLLIFNLQVASLDHR